MTAANTPPLQGFLRADGRKGIRNVIAVAYLVECAHHVAREIVGQFRPAFDAFDDPAADHEPPVHLIGALVRALETTGLQGVRVLDRDEVEQTALGLAHQIDPVRPGQQFGGPGGRLTPRGRMPARAVQRDGQMKRYSRHVDTRPFPDEEA